MDKYDHQFFGHPRGLSTLFFTELWERFSYYGMRAILLFYMLDKIKNGGLAIDAPLGASIMAIYGALVFMSSVVGGFVSDRILGPRRTVLYGGILIMFGHIVLSTPMGMIGLLLSILLITMGTGLLKPNVSDMVGGLYSKTDSRRDAGFTIYYMGINIGALIAPWIVGWLGQTYNYHLGFSIAAIGMFVGLLQYYFNGRKYLSDDGLKPTDPLNSDSAKNVIKGIILGLIALAIILGIMGITGEFSITNIILLITIVGVVLPVVYFTVIIRSSKVTDPERKRIYAYIFLFIASIVFWSIYEQGSVVLALFASSQTNLHILGMHIEPSQLQSVNALFVIMYTPMFAFLWTKLGKRQPSSPNKFAIGMVFAGISFLVMVIPVALFGTSAKVSPFWLILCWGLVEVGEMLISPVGLSLTTKLAPKAFQAQMMSVWFLGDAAAQSINAQIVRFYQPETEIAYFSTFGIIAILVGLLLFAFRNRLQRLIQVV
ncbi:peptide MFS transporter [Loigolactobacillus iwatensis]|uniref:peptide MFS transporter n=1 Tax=Loigolactobacillus iwatensis TaxID=1267156 RepID=UPI000F7F9AFB|nr:peptide MFS transporter [Loigolactobacillus iwatensis]